MEFFLGGLGAGILIGIGFMWWSVVRHRRTPSLTKFVVFSFTVIIIYTISEMAVSIISGVSHPDLTAMIGSTFGGEMLCCAIVKVFKLRGENGNE